MTKRFYSVKITYKSGSKLKGMNKQNLLKVNEEKRTAMLNKLKEYSPSDLLTNYKKILRSVFNSQVDSLSQKDKERVKQEISSIYNRVVAAMNSKDNVSKEIDIGVLKEFLVYPYPEWFTLECSSLLFEIYELLVNRLYHLDKSCEERGLKRSLYDRSILPNIIPNLNIMFVYSRLVKFEVGHMKIDNLMAGDVGEEVMEVLEMKHKSHIINKIVNDNISSYETVSKAESNQTEEMTSGSGDRLLNRPDSFSLEEATFRTVKLVKSSIKFTSGEIQEEKNKEYLFDTSKKEGNPQERMSEGISTEKIRQLGVIDAEKSKQLLMKLCFCLGFKFSQFSTSKEQELILEMMNASKHFDTLLMDLINLSLLDRFSKISLDFFLLFMDVSYKSALNYPQYHLYAFREKFYKRIKTMGPHQLRKVLRLVTRTQPLHFNIFNRQLISTIIKESTFEKYSVSSKCSIIYYLSKNLHTTDAVLSTLPGCITGTDIGQMSIFDLKMLMMSAQYNKHIYKIDVAKYVPSLEVYGGDGFYVQSMIEEFTARRLLHI